MEEDIRLGSLLSPAMYRLVRYEDLTEDPVGVMRELYNFTGVNLTNVIIQKINDHFHAENITRQIRQVFSSIEALHREGKKIKNSSFQCTVCITYK